MAEPRTTAIARPRWQSRHQSRALGAARKLKNLAAGALACQLWIGALVALGWSLRHARIAAWRVWAREGAEAPAMPRPGWMASAETPFEPGTRLRRVFGGLGANLRLGLGAALTGALLFAPAGICWTFAWRYGWDNSFNKGYEQAWIGPTVGVWGIALFIPAMLYVPLAHARYSITGDWRVVFRPVPLLRMLWAAPWRWLQFAAVAALVALPYLVFHALPYFLTNIRPELSDASDAELLRVLRSFYFYGAALLFPLFLGLRHVAAAVYAHGLVAAWRGGRLPVDRLHPAERAVVHAFAPRPFGPFARARRGAGRLLAVPLLLLLGFVVPATIFVGQFLNYDGVRSWINYAPLQVPMANHIPNSLGQNGPAAAP